MTLARSAILALVAATVIAGAASAAEGEKKKGGGANFVQLPTLTATMIRSTGKRGVMTVDVGLDVPDGSLRDRATASTPRLRDAYIRFLQTYASALPPGGLPNPDTIAVALQRSTDQVLAKPGAKLLLGSIMVN